MKELSGLSGVQLTPNLMFFLLQLGPHKNRQKGMEMRRQEEEEGGKKAFMGIQVLSLD